MIEWEKITGTRGLYLYHEMGSEIEVRHGALIVTSDYDVDPPPIPIELIEELIAKWRSK